MVKYLFRLVGVPPDQAIKTIDLNPNLTIKDAMPIIVWKYEVSPFIPWRVIFKGKVLEWDCLLSNLDISSSPPPGVSRNTLTIMFTGKFPVKVVYIVGLLEAGAESLQKQMNEPDKGPQSFNKLHWGYTDLDFQLTEVEHFNQIVSWVYDDEKAKLSKYYSNYKPDGIYAVYDCRNLKSLTYLKETLVKIIQKWETSIPVIIVGNYFGITGSSNVQRVTQDDIDAFMEIMGISKSHHLYINSKTKDSLQESLTFLSQMLY